MTGITQALKLLILEIWRLFYQCRYTELIKKLPQTPRIQKFAEKFGCFLEVAFKGALLVTCAIVVLKYFGYLDRFQLISLNAISSVVGVTYSKSSTKSFEDPAAKCHQGGPQTCKEFYGRKTYLINIDQRAYETEFEQSSPLNRCKMASIIHAISQYKPDVLAIDFDLSPNPTAHGSKAETKSLDDNCDTSKISDACELGKTSNGSGESTLNACLRQIAKNGTRVVLLLPEPVQTEKAIQTKKQWMLDLLENNNIQFGLGTVFTSDGIVAKYLNVPSTLSNAIYRSAYRTHNQFEYSDNLYERKLLETARILFEPIDADAKKDALGDDFSQRLDLLLNRPWRDAVGQEVLTNNLFDHLNIEFNELPASQQKVISGKLDELNFPEFAGNIVILGGDYGSHDYYNSAAGFIPGVKLHFASFYSLVTPFGGNNYLLLFFIDLFAGTALGIAISCLFKRTSKNYFAFRLLSLCTIALLFWLLLYCAYLILLKWNLWVNPTPLFVGIMLTKLVNFVGKHERKKKLAYIFENNLGLHEIEDSRTSKNQTHSTSNTNLNFHILDVVFEFLIKSSIIITALVIVIK